MSTRNKRPTYLVFGQPTDSKSRKTLIWSVSSSLGGPPLGRIVWRGGWRRYVFQPFNDTVFDSSCLRELAEKLLHATQAHCVTR